MPEVVEPISDEQGWLAGGGEMSRLIRERDWVQTALGPIESWPQSLKTSVSICLASRFPIVLYWGPECVVLYNDAYRTILASGPHCPTGSARRVIVLAGADH
jgi:hypothetical protein